MSCGKQGLVFIVSFLTILIFGFLWINGLGKIVETIFLIAIEIFIICLVSFYFYEKIKEAKNIREFLMSFSNLIIVLGLITLIVIGIVIISYIWQNVFGFRVPDDY